jgi:predicted transcriptional regulator
MVLSDARKEIQVSLVNKAADIVASYVRNNAMPASSIEPLITSVHKHLVNLANTGPFVIFEDTQEKSVAEVNAPTPVPRKIADKRTIFPPAEALAQGETEKPFVPVDRSITDAKLICLVCGKQYATLLRHIRTQHGLSEESYKLRFSLPHDYPMVAPAYSETRSKLAVEAGFGSVVRTSRQTSEKS